MHRIVIPRLPRVNCRYLNPHCIVLPCRKPARFVVNRESGVVHHAAIVDVVSMEWSAASMSRTRTSTSRTKASARRTCRERQRSCQCLRLKRYNGNDHRAATSDPPFQNARTSPLRVHRIVIPRSPCPAGSLINPFKFRASQLVFSIVLGKISSHQGVRPMRRSIWPVSTVWDCDNRIFIDPNRSLFF